MFRKKEVITSLFFLCALCLLLGLSGCGLLCGNGICNNLPLLKETFFSCPDDCPLCDDLNKCTYTFYNYSTQNCEFVNITDCCGNNYCDVNETCPMDCRDCNDGDKCTHDYYNLFISDCSYEEIFPCCGNDVCERVENCSNCTIDCGSCVTAEDLFISINTKLNRSYEYELDYIDENLENKYIASKSNMKIYEFIDKQFSSEGDLFEFAANHNHNFFQEYSQLLEFQKSFNLTEQKTIASVSVLLKTMVHLNSTKEPKLAAGISYMAYPCQNNLLIEIYPEKAIQLLYFTDEQELNNLVQRQRLNLISEQVGTLEKIDEVCT